MTNPNADRIAALSRQSGTPMASVVAQLAGTFLQFANDTSEAVAAAATLNYAKDWLALIAETYEPSPEAQAQGLALQVLLVGEPTPFSEPYPIYREPLMRLLVAVAKGNTTNPNPTPAFGARR